MGVPFDGKPIRGAEQSWGAWSKGKSGVKVRCPECGVSREIPYGDVRDKYSQVGDDLISKRPHRCVCGFSRRISILCWSEGMTRG